MQYSSQIKVMNPLKELELYANPRYFTPKCCCHVTIEVNDVPHIK